jgi:hypothetical protein
LHADSKGSDLKVQNSSEKKTFKLSDEQFNDLKGVVEAKISQRLSRAQVSLGSTRGGLAMYEMHRQKVCLPQNWHELVSTYEIFSLIHHMIEKLDLEVSYAEEASITVCRETGSFDTFLNGVVYALHETGFKNTNYRSTSLIERARVSMCLRRAQSAVAAMGIPWGLTKFAQSEFDISNTPSDWVYQTVVAEFPNKSDGNKVAALFSRLLSRYAARRSTEISELNLSDFIMSFEETWANLGLIKKDARGTAKRTKDGRLKRYHPELPRVAWMTSEDVSEAKQAWSPVALQLAYFRDNWSFNNASEYIARLEAMKIYYQYSIQVSKAIRLPLDARLERIGGNRSMSKRTFMQRMQHQEHGAQEIDWEKIHNQIKSILLAMAKCIQSSNERVLKEESASSAMRGDSLA